MALDVTVVLMKSMTFANQRLSKYTVHLSLCAQSSVLWTKPSWMCTVDLNCEICKTLVLLEVRSARHKAVG